MLQYQTWLLGEDERQPRTGGINASLTCVMIICYNDFISYVLANIGDAHTKPMLP